MAEVQVATDNNAATAAAEWECSVCTYRNTDISSDFCVMCESPRPTNAPKNKNSSLSRLEGSGALDEPEEDFDDNDDGSVDATDAIDGSNGEDPRDAACMMSFANWNQDDFVAWKCVSCTYMNENPLFLKCEMCGQNRPRAGMNAGGDDNDDEDFEKKQQRIQQQDEMLLALERGKEIQAEQGFLFASANDEDDEEEPDLFA